jgi:hypothetical protein
VTGDAVPATLVLGVWNFNLVVGTFVPQAPEVRGDVGVAVSEVPVQVEDQLLVVRAHVLPVVLNKFEQLLKFSFAN